MRSKFWALALAMLVPSNRVSRGTDAEVDCVLIAPYAC